MAFAGVPVQEGLASEHGREVLRDALEPSVAFARGGGGGLAIEGCVIYPNVNWHLLSEGS